MEDGFLEIYDLEKSKIRYLDIYVDYYVNYVEFKENLHRLDNDWDVDLSVNLLRT